MDETYMGLYALLFPRCQRCIRWAGEGRDYAVLSPSRMLHACGLPQRTVCGLSTVAPGWRVLEENQSTPTPGTEP